MPQGVLGDPIVTRWSRGLCSDATHQRDVCSRSDEERTRLQVQTREVAFDHAGGRLAGTVHLPDGAKNHPGMVIVHGSGAVDRTGADGSLAPVIDWFVRSGVAVLAYDKPGVGGSTGDWTTQTFADRAAESIAAVRLLGAQPEVRADAVGLWAISQGGWVAPLSAATTGAGVAFAIVVSGSSITPCEQVTWLLGNDMRAEGFEAEAVAVALSVLKERTREMDAGVDAGSILDAERVRHGDQPWYRFFESTPAEVDFMRTIWHFDVRPVLERMHCPVFAVWGGRDPHMPVQECASSFAAAMARSGNESFRVEIFPGASHRLRIDDGMPGARFAPGYLAGMTDWLFHQITH